MTERHKYMRLHIRRLHFVLVVSLAVVFAGACGTAEVTETGETVSASAERLTGDIRFLGGTTSFGECAGFCYTDLSFEDRSVTMTFKTWGEIEHVVTATLTDEGAFEVDSSGDGIAGASLVETFGCPDCADGGAASLKFTDSSGEVSEFAFEYGLPLDELSAAWGLTESLRMSLAMCEDSALVVVSANCVPIAEVDNGYN